MRRQGAAIALMVLLALAAGLGAGISGADGASVRCRVPAALLCLGCANAIRVMVLANGQCRVTFDTAGSNTTATRSADLEIDVQIARVPRQIARPLDRRLRAAKQLRLQKIARLRSVPALPGGRCFEFSGRRYCE